MADKPASYGTARKLSAAKLHEFNIVSNYKYGYRNREDVTNLPPGVLITGSQNVLTNVSERIQIRQGYSLDGQVSSINAPILSAYDWLTRNNGERHLRAGFRSGNSDIENSFVQLSSIATTGSDFANNIVKNGDYVYITSGETFNIINVSDPALPVLQSNNLSTGDLIGCDISDDGNTFYAIDTDGNFTCYDVSDKNNPIQLGVLATGLSFVNQPGQQILQVVDSTTVLLLSTIDDFLQPIDVSNPNTPITKNNSISGPMSGIIVSEDGSILYIYDNKSAAVVEVQKWEIVQGVTIVFNFLGNCDTEIIADTPDTGCFTVKNNNVYILFKADSVYSLYIFDDSGDEGNLLSTTITALDPTHNITAISVDGDYLVSTDGEFDSIFFFNISDPSAPEQIQTNSQGGYGVILSGNYFYVISTSQPTNLIVYQLSTDTLGKLQYRYVDAAGIVTWRDLMTGVTSVNYNFTSFWFGADIPLGDGTWSAENLRICLFVNGNSEINIWNGAITTFKSATSNTLTKEGTNSWADDGFFVNGGKTIVINGIEYTYGGGEDTTTLTGVSPDPSAAGLVVGDVIHQQVVTIPNSNFTDGPPATFKNALISTLNNQLFLAALDSSVVWISRVNNFIDFGSSTPRQTGEGATLILDSQIVAFVPQENYMYISAGQDLWYNVSFELQTSTVGVTYEQVDALPLKTGRQQGAFSQACVSHMKNNIIMVTNEPTIDLLGRLENYFGTPMTKNISDPIKLDIDGYDFTDASIFYFKYYIYVAVPKNEVVLVYNLATSSWEAPQTLPISRFYIVDGELYGHSYLTSESYKLFTGYADRVYPGFSGFPIDAKWVFSYQNYGSRFYKKSANYLYLEGYINQNTIATAKITYELDGCATFKTFQVDGSDTQIVCIPSSQGSLGKVSLGKQKLGGENQTSIQNLPPKFRVEKSFPNTDFFECSISLEVLGSDNRLELLAFGMNIAGATQMPVSIRQ